MTLLLIQVHRTQQHSTGHINKKDNKRGRVKERERDGTQMWKQTFYILHSTSSLYKEVILNRSDGASFPSIST